MSTRAKVLVVGSYATALVMETQRLPAKGETLVGRGYREVHGGKGSNQAVQAARLGAEVRFLCRVGTDARGESMRTLMRSEGVAAEGILRDAALPTGVGFIIVDAAGHNLIAVDLGANAALSERDVEAHRPLFEWADVVVAQLEIPLATAVAALRLAKACGARTVLNPAPAADLQGRDLACIDFLLPNENEARVCAGLPDAGLADAMARLTAWGCRSVVTTTGPDGCLWMDEGSAPRSVATYPVRVVDTVGAGDAFAAAFAVALGEGWTTEAALRFAHAAAALSTTKPDTVPSYHDRRAVDGFLREAEARGQGAP